MSLTNRKILWENGTTDGFQLIRMPYRAPFGGVAAPEKDDDAVPKDYMVAYVAANGGGGAPTGSAGGDLGGSYPNPSVKGLDGISLDFSAIANGHILIYNSGLDKWVTYLLPTVIGDMFKVDYDPAGLNQQVTVHTIYVDLGTISAMSPSDIIPNQAYVITDVDDSINPAIQFIKVFGEVTINGSNEPVNGFSQRAEVYLTEAKEWMPCQFNMSSKRVDISPITKKISFDAAAIQKGNKTPLVLVTGYAGLYAQLETVGAYFHYVAPDFDGAFDLKIFYRSSGDPLFSADGFFGLFTSDFSCTVCPVNYSTAQKKTLNINDDIVARMDGDSTVGGSNVDFFITYKYILP